VVKPTRVVNIRVEPCDILMMRPSEWGNPYIIGRDGTRAEVIAKHDAWFQMQTWLLAKLPKLVGLRLGCCCHPLPCHVDNIIRKMKELGLE
jgi:hypothetical protein